MSKDLSPRQLNSRFRDIMSTEQYFTAVDITNPMQIIYKGQYLYVYIKNLSYAYLGNPDVTRAQLPKREEFENIIESPYYFIFLGYDAQHKVYATWNPHHAKQRLNTRQYVSFYSRLSKQIEAGENRSEVHFEDSKRNIVWVFHESLLPQVLSKVFIEFENNTLYVAVGSKARQEANRAFAEFSDRKNAARFDLYLRQKGDIEDDDILDYSATISSLIKDRVIHQYRKIFLSKERISEYKSVLDDFCKVEEIQMYSQHIADNVKKAMILYIDFLAGNEIIVPKSGELHEDVDYEKCYTSQNGKLTKIANPELLRLLRPVLDTPFKQTMVAFRIVEDFYKDRYSESMSLSDWMRLFDAIDWSN